MKKRTPTQNLLAQRVRMFRKKKGLTQAQLAEKIGKTVEMVCHLENGTASTKISTLEDICKILEVDVYELFTNRTDIQHLKLSDDLRDLFYELQQADDDVIKSFQTLARKVLRAEQKKS